MTHKTPLLFNPRSAEFRVNPYPTYEYLRTHHPIYYRQEQKDWVLTRYADIATVFKDPSFGRSEKKSSSDQIETPIFAHPLLKRRYESQQLMGLWLVLLNPPDHTRIRNLLSTPFTQSRVKLLQSHIEETIDFLIDRVANQGKIDIISDLAFPLTLSINLKILGIPQSQWHDNFKQWSDSLAVIADVDVTPIANEQGLLAVAGLAEYFRNWIDQCRHSPLLLQKDNLINVLIKAEAAEQITEEELLATCIFMFTVGHSSTTNLIGISILNLLNHPQQLQLLQTDKSLIKPAIAEVLRYESPVQGVSRTVVADIQLSNQIIRQGEVVNCIIAAANRDPAKFLEPEKFDITRNPNPYLSFGQGIHNCIGKHLAKLVTETTVLRVVTRLPKIKIEQELADLKWDDSFLSRGLKELMVKF